MTAHAIKYTLIKTEGQYQQYCTILEGLLEQTKTTVQTQDEIDLLTLLIKTWDDQHNTFSDPDPVKLIKYLMQEHQMKQKDLSALLGVSKSIVSEILHYKRGLSKELIRSLSNQFKVSQEAFNKPYPLVTYSEAK